MNRTINLLPVIAHTFTADKFLSARDKFDYFPSQELYDALKEYGQNNPPLSNKRSGAEYDPVLVATAHLKRSSLGLLGDKVLRTEEELSDILRESGIVRDEDLARTIIAKIDGFQSRYGAGVGLTINKSRRPQEEKSYVIANYYWDVSI